jgi:hypothetical protein
MKHPDTVMAYESQCDTECHGLQTRLPLLRADLESIMNDVVDNETALKSLAHEANWEWKLRNVLFVRVFVEFVTRWCVVSSYFILGCLSQFLPRLVTSCCKRNNLSHQFDVKGHHAPRSVMKEELERWITICVMIRRITTVRLCTTRYHCCEVL